MTNMPRMPFSQVSFDFSTVERQEEETDSPSFPVSPLEHSEVSYNQLLYI